jgi:transposase
VTVGSGSKPTKVTTGSAAESYHSYIEKALAKGLTAQRIWQDLREEFGFGHGYGCIKRYVRRLKKTHPEVSDVMEHPPGKEAQVDFFKGLPTLDPSSGRWRRP